MEVNESKNLSALFSEGWKLFQSLEKSEEPSTSKHLQNIASQCINIFVRCTHMVNLLALFSPNENIGEVSTQNLKFLLLPAFLGELYMKSASNDRQHSLQNAMVYFNDYLKRCGKYNVTKDASRYPPNEAMPEEQKSLHVMNRDRQEKIQRYKESKEIHERIQVMEKRLKENAETLDDTTTREYYLDWLKLSLNNSVENITSIKRELEILEHIGKIQQGKVEPPQPPKELPIIKPVLITREALKKQVFGAGYRNLPTMTDIEYFEKELREGKIVQDYSDQPVNNRQSQEEESTKKESDDEHDDEKLSNAREWDDWKDTHRRGEGNKEQHG